MLQKTCHLLDLGQETVLVKLPGGWGEKMFISEVLTEVHETDGVAVKHVAKRQSPVRENSGPLVRKIEYWYFAL
ncbi:hypothetical protein DPMN_072139 [Dreissena polymorpha]|uniref:Uncharacterized protein n=1 Tax=Dreissena polymorpha TaxID=45954 RepID=A0A9D3Z917_DREPO|nr:hypothetical protein DPMN_072139 [Dreissena polymorpha]